MSYKKVEITAFDCECDNCGHRWRSLKAELPTHCPKRGCSNPTAWNKRTVKNVKGSIPESVTFPPLVKGQDSWRISTGDGKAFEDVQMSQPKELIYEIEE